MGLPAVATNFSGNTQFMTASNSFLVAVARMRPWPEEETWFAGLQHAVPDVPALRDVMTVSRTVSSGAPTCASARYVTRPLPPQTTRPPRDASERNWQESNNNNKPWLPGYHVYGFRTQ